MLDSFLAIYIPLEFIMCYTANADIALNTVKPIRYALGFVEVAWLILERHDHYNIQSRGF